MQCCTFAALCTVQRLPYGGQELSVATETTMPAEPPSIREKGRFSSTIFYLDPTIDEVGTLFSKRNSIHFSDPHGFFHAAKMQRTLP
jgi:hypothetical protein